MNLIEISEPPQNIETYVEPSGQWVCEENILADQLRGLIQQNSFNIHIKDCCVRMISSLDKELTENGYRVMVRPTTPARGEFFLETT